MHELHIVALEQVLHGLLHGLQVFESKYFPETQDVQLEEEPEQVLQLELHE